MRFKDVEKQKATRRAWRKANRKSEVERNSRNKLRGQRTVAGRIGILLKRSRHRAAELGLAHDIDKNDIAVPTHCPVLGIPLSTEPGGPLANRFSLDRSDNSKGYVKGNVQVISYRANTIKSNATLAEVRALARYMADLETLHEIIS